MRNGQVISGFSKSFLILLWSRDRGYRGDEVAGGAIVNEDHLLNFQLKLTLGFD